MSNALLRDAHRPVATDAIESLEVGDGFAVVAGWASQPRLSDLSLTFSVMRGVDAVVVPSIWWENSPLVIQEALASRRPIICSDIGGMAEKVRDGIDGFHFRAGDPRALAELFATLGRAPERLQTMQSTMRRPLSIDETMARIIGVYQTAFSHTSREGL